MSERAPPSATEPRGAPAAARVGDLLLLEHPGSSALAPEWLVVASEGDRFLVLPADDQPLAGTRDFVLPSDDPLAPLTVRCAHGVWLPNSASSAAHLTGTASPLIVKTALAARVPPPEDAPGFARAREVDQEPSYRELVRGLSQHRAALLEHFVGARPDTGALGEPAPPARGAGAVRAARPAGARRGRRLGAAAAALAACAALAVVVGRSEDEVEARYRQRGAEPTRIAALELSLGGRRCLAYQVMDDPTPCSIGEARVDACLAFAPGAPPYLALLARDARGAITVVFPPAAAGAWTSAQVATQPVRDDRCASGLSLLGPLHLPPDTREVWGFLSAAPADGHLLLEAFAARDLYGVREATPFQFVLSGD